MKTVSILKIFSALSMLLLIPTALLAHTGVGFTGSFMNGFLHPLGGLDHLLAMVAVGVWATQQNRSAKWAVPAAFVAFMMAGAWMGYNGMVLPFVEQGIVLSVLAMGLVVMLALKVPAVAGMALVGLFAMFHGHAHGTEVASGAQFLSYVGGFSLATAALHLTGMAMIGQIKSVKRLQVSRVVGAVVLVCGIVLVFA